MTEITKTLTFFGVAIASGLLAFVTKTGPVGEKPLAEIGKPLFESFTDPLKAKNLKIVKFDEGLANVDQIEVKEVDGIWVLPSHEGYPADAENRVRDAATPFVDMQIINVISDKDGDHSLYGVLEPPQDAQSQVPNEGVGTLVNIKDASGNNLVNLIIGKKVKGQDGQRFVRRPGQSRVYIAEIDPDQLPVKFEEWIERDLLKVSSWDINQIVLKDYSFQIAQTLRGPIPDYDPRIEIKLTDDNGTWKLDELLEARGGKLQPSELLEGEELNEERLRSLKTALDELEIVDVERKPQGLGQDLKVDKGFFNDQSSVDSLAERGIYAVQFEGAGVELLSTDGEVLARTKDGVEYVLRFGRVAGVDTESGEGKLNRYLLVSARVNYEQFPEPELEPLPEAPAAKADENSDTDADAEVTDDTEVDADVEDATDIDSDTEEDAGDDDQSDEDADATGDASSDDATENSDDDDSSQESDIEAERKRITKENQRKIDERDDKIKTAEEKVRELNFRFADWYYVISEDVYKKIHLERLDIIKVSDEAKEEGPGIDAFRKLEEEGLKEEDEDESGTSDSE